MRVFLCLFLYIGDMAKKKNVEIATKWLASVGISVIFIPGMIYAYTNNNLEKINKTIEIMKGENTFRTSGEVVEIVDGDTFYLDDFSKIRMLAIDAPNSGEAGVRISKEELEKMILNKKVWLEYDRYRVDKYYRILAWIWIGCESDPLFTSYDYMHLSMNKSKEGLVDNPKGCSKGKLVNEELVKEGLAKTTFYKDRGELKYQKRLLGK